MSLDKRLAKTLQLYDKPLRGGEYIDAYNLAIHDNGIAGTITTRTVVSGQTFVVVKEEKDGRNRSM